MKRTCLSLILSPFAVAACGGDFTFEPAERIGMALAVLYSLAEFRQVLILSIPTMARTHGVINAIGFSLCGIVGWTLAALQVEGGDRDGGKS